MMIRKQRHYTKLYKLPTYDQAVNLWGKTNRKHQQYMLYTYIFNLPSIDMKYKELHLFFLEFGALK